MPPAKRERLGCDDGNSTDQTAATLSRHENDSVASSSGQHSDAETPPKGSAGDDDAQAAAHAASSLAAVLLSLAAHPSPPAQLGQPASAPAGLEVMSIRSMCSGAANDDEDDGDEDEGPADSVQIEQARLTGEAFKQDFSKKQCRRETNRAAAKQSRQRKKCHLETLETRVADLERERAALLARVEALSVENCLLRRAPSDARPEQAVRQEAAAVGPCIAGTPVAALGAATTGPKQEPKAAGAVHGGSSLGLMAGRVAAASAVQGAGLLDQLARAASTMS